jgi:ankyrin repeat protein
MTKEEFHVELSAALQERDEARLLAVIRKATSQNALDLSAAVAVHGGPPKSPLYRVAEYGLKDACELLIAAGAKPDLGWEKRYSPMHIAASNNHRDVVAVMLAAGMDVNAFDRVGRTALHDGAEEGAGAACRCLLDAGADPDVLGSPYMSPLFLAATAGQVEVCRMLVEAGASLSARADSDERVALSPLQGAINKGEVGAVRFFLSECGEDLDQVAGNGKTLWQLAEAHDVNWGARMVPLLHSVRTERELAGVLDAVSDVTNSPRRDTSSPL